MIIDGTIDFTQQRLHISGLLFGRYGAIGIGINDLEYGGSYHLARREAQP
ncbi:MAG TPA: hypothetical protein VGC31_08550 [Paenirhodobacter sp.]